MWFARDPPMSSNRYLCGIFISATLNLADRGEILTFPDTLTTQGLSLHLNIVGGEILTFPDTLTTQGLSLWSLNKVLMALPLAGAHSVAGPQTSPVT